MLPAHIAAIITNTRKKLLILSPCLYQNHVCIRHVGKFKKPRFLGVLQKRKAENKRWIKNGKNAVDKVPDSGVKYTQTNAENKPPFAFGTIWGIFKCKN